MPTLSIIGHSSGFCVRALSSSVGYKGLTSANLTGEQCVFRLGRELRAAECEEVKRKFLTGKLARVELCKTPGFQRKSWLGNNYGLISSTLLTQSPIIAMASSGSHSPSAAAFSGMSSAGPPGKVPKFENRLAKEQSPYLLQHKNNPVDWYPWGEEAFAKAKAENKPIFLSVGYSTCHWCHVMEVESFESEEIAELLNKSFVSIKVDREERPDVDKVYMTYIQATMGGGGWPMNVFLSPNLKPVVGGTYFPPTSRFGQPGFSTVLRAVAKAWQERASELEEQAEAVMEQLREAMGESADAGAGGRQRRGVEGGTFSSCVERCAQELERRFDSQLGGFGSAPKFPRPAELTLMMQRRLRLRQDKRDADAARVEGMVLKSLTAMARGGIHDHVGGGFHRYSVDEYWHVPHFEKMMYDQGQLANSYLDAFCATGDTQHAIVARDILDYIRRRMTHAEGGIFSAEDADSQEVHGSSIRKEGAFYIWASNEIDDILGKGPAEVLKHHYYVKEGGNCDLSSRSDPHGEFRGKNVLMERAGLEDTARHFKAESLEEMRMLLGVCRKALYDEREKRPAPRLDDKIIVSWNGLVISALARAARVLQTEEEELEEGTASAHSGGAQSFFHFPVEGTHPLEYLRAAERAAAFIRRELFEEETGRLWRSFRVHKSAAAGFVDDYAFLIAGLIQLFQASGDVQWLQWAMRLQNTQDTLFLDEENGAYFNVAAGDPSILIRSKEDYDGAEPSGNSVSALNLLYFSSITSGEQSRAFRVKAEQTLAMFERRLNSLPLALPLTCCAADVAAAASGKRQEVVIAGGRGAADTQQLLSAAHVAATADTVIIPVDVDNSEDVAFWTERNPGILAMAQKGPNGTALAYICQNFTCKSPTNSTAAVKKMLREGFSMPTIVSFDFPNIK